MHLSARVQMLKPSEVEVLRMAILGWIPTACCLLGSSNVCCETYSMMGIYAAWF